MLYSGAELDGPIKYPRQGKVRTPPNNTTPLSVISLFAFVPLASDTPMLSASQRLTACRQVAVLRSPDGHMIGISESIVGTDG